MGAAFRCARGGRDQRLHDRGDRHRGAIIYYGHGVLVPGLAAAAVVGVEVGSFPGMRASARIDGRWLRLLLAIVLFVVAIVMSVGAR